MFARAHPASRILAGLLLASAALVLPGCVSTIEWLAGGGDDPNAVYDGSRCKIEGGALHCAHHSDTLYTGLSGITPRKLHWQVPVGEAPAQGWPVVILFQGTSVSADYFWTVFETEGLGAFNQGLLTMTLLDAGFAVLTPEARLAGAGAWETNFVGVANNWEELSGDHAFMLDIFAGIDAGDFGELDPSRLYAAGISSGGYMTSRMDLSYRERFSALAIQSASHATCAGDLCEVPTPQSPEHRPTLFLHGAEDSIVPVETMWPYHEALLAAGVDSEAIVAEGVGHAWLDEAPEAITAWFESH